MVNERYLRRFWWPRRYVYGQLLTYSGMVESKQVSWLPSYGPEMRGGTANCNVMVLTR